MVLLQAVENSPPKLLIVQVSIRALSVFWMLVARRPQRSTRATLVASDFTLPRSRRRASSPGARSELARPRRVRRRLVRSGEGLQPRRSGGSSQRLGSDADSILNALERSISARDNAGLSTSTEHRQGSAADCLWSYDAI